MIQALRWAALGSGTIALALRAPGWPAVGVTALAGTAGVLAWQRRGERRPWSDHVVPLLAGLAAFGFVRWSWPTPALVVGGVGVAASALAAVAEEALFRRALYGAVERWGDAVAVLVPALAFAVVHLPIYGWGALPIDLAAGLVFGWQRWASGTWLVPAATHVFANMIQVG